MNILFLTHNIPYPPNKGEKVRTFHFLQGLAEHHNIILCSLCRGPFDPAHREALLELCEEVYVFPLHRWVSRFRAVLALLTGQPLTYGYFSSTALAKLIPAILKEREIDLLFASCSSTGQYLFPFPNIPKVIDFIDIDSEKWGVFSQATSFPKSWVFKEERRRLRQAERALSHLCDATIVTTGTEQRRLLEIDPEGADHSFVVQMGVDTERFPFSPRKGGKRIVFIGQLDYLPNIDAVLSFYTRILPIIRKKHPDAEFQIVGRNPHPSIRAICTSAVITGEVSSVVPYLEEASVFVAPFRMAFGVQSKVLEAMAAGVPVVATTLLQQGLDVLPGRDLLFARTDEEFAEQVLKVLEEPTLAKTLAENARRYVLESHSWPKNLQSLEHILARSQHVRGRE